MTFPPSLSGWVETPNFSRPPTQVYVSPLTTGNALCDEDKIFVLSSESRTSSSIRPFLTHHANRPVLSSALNGYNRASSFYYAFLLVEVTPYHPVSYIPHFLSPSSSVCYPPPYFELHPLYKESRLLYSRAFSAFCPFFSLNVRFAHQWISLELCFSLPSTMC